MLIWYEDNDLKIEFDKMPDVTMTYPAPYYGEEKNRRIDDKPFLNKRDLRVVITDRINNAVYDFVIEQGYTWDGATIPRIFWRLIGANTSPEFLIPSMLHDVICENHHYINNNRYLSTLILERLLYCSGVCPFKRWLMKHSVDNYQKLAGRW